MRRVLENVIYSPHDVTAYLAGDFVAWMDRLYFEMKSSPSEKYDAQLQGIEIKKDEANADLELIKKKGFAHEQTYFQQLQKSVDVCAIPEGRGGIERTLEAMKAGKAVIFQGELQYESFGGRPDFLVRVDGISLLGKGHYLPRDTKLARSVRCEHAIQLCAYADMLAGLQGVRPRRIEFILGDQSLVSLPVDRYFYYFLRLRDAFFAFQQQFDAESMPNVGLQRDFGHWSTVADRLLEQCDHISRTARMTLSQVKRLEAEGVTTMKQLAARKRPVPRLQPEILDRLRRQASLQLASATSDLPKFAVLAHPPETRHGLAILPPPTSADVFFDMEGFPLIDEGLEYLFGATTLEKEKMVFHDWWAHDQIQERHAFEQFVDWVHQRWTKNPSLHVYHYAAYETTALRRLMGKHASREAKVDDLLRNNVFVDLYTVVRQGVMIGTAGYSLKDIEPLFAPKRGGAVTTAGGSVVAYQAWLDAGEDQDWRKSKTLEEIRDYNLVDCESLVHLQTWLLELQKGEGIAYVPPTSSASAATASIKPAVPRPRTALAETMLNEVANGNVTDPDRKRLQSLLAWLLEFHWRESKPVFWRKFDRHEMDEEQLIDDIDCLGGLQASGEVDGRCYEYIYDPEQETKLDEGSKCFFAHDLMQRCNIAKIDLAQGRVSVLMPVRHSPPPKRLGLIPDEFVDPEAIAEAVERFVRSWHDGSLVSQAVVDLLERRPPRVKGWKGGLLVDPAKTLLPQLIALVCKMDRTTLCIQGPPGCGKTYSSGEVIAQLLKDGKRVGVTALSHKAVLNVLSAVLQAMTRLGVDAPVVKVGGEGDEPLFKDGRAIHDGPKGGAKLCAGPGPFVVGGTAWFFSRDDVQGKLDYLFVDEAGQFSLANVVAVGQAGANLVLVGDQMQLAQPLQGSHPGESGRSGLEYLLNGKATIPPDFGVLLDETHRLHPDVCRLVSDMTYEGRLRAHPKTAKRRVVPAKKAKLLEYGTGVQFVSVFHEGNGQCSDEEVEKIQELITDLQASRFVDENSGVDRKLTHDDILLVAPYNMQVGRLRKCLGEQVRIGSVDKFQGQEAPVVIVSMCASSLEDCPRGAEFLFDPNRLNVAISRAQCLAIVVACPTLLAPRCTSLDQMELVNAFCRIEDYARPWPPEE